MTQYVFRMKGRGLNNESYPLKEVSGFSDYLISTQKIDLNIF